MDIPSLLSCFLSFGSDDDREALDWVCLRISLQTLLRILVLSVLSSSFAVPAGPVPPFFRFPDFHFRLGTPSSASHPTIWLSSEEHTTTIQHVQLVEQLIIQYSLILHTWLAVSKVISYKAEAVRDTPSTAGLIELSTPSLAALFIGQVCCPWTAAPGWVGLTRELVLDLFALSVLKQPSEQLATRGSLKRLLSIRSICVIGLH